MLPFAKKAPEKNSHISSDEFLLRPTRGKRGRKKNSSQMEASGLLSVNAPLKYFMLASRPCVVAGAISRIFLVVYLFGAPLGNPAGRFSFGGMGVRLKKGGWGRQERRGQCYFFSLLFCLFPPPPPVVGGSPGVLFLCGDSA